MEKISFAPPDITDAEIDAVVAVLKSGWITTGPVVKEFEREIAAYVGVARAVAMSAATPALEIALRMYGVVEGDEVITTPYTYAASANVITHLGAKPVFVDLEKNSFNMDPAALMAAVTVKTKVILPVDFGGYPADYDACFAAAESAREYFKPANARQKALGRPLILADAAHSFGAYYRGKRTGGVADWSVFSFHAVKNLITAEGGALCLQELGDASADELYAEAMLYALHGQNKDALAKERSGWRYDILFPGYKCNMTDLHAAIGLSQLKRYDAILARRHAIFKKYVRRLAGNPHAMLPVWEDDLGTKSCYHLFALRLKDVTEERRDALILKGAAAGVSFNVHFQPLPMLSAYKNLGYDIGDYPNAYRQYVNEISLPIHHKLSDDDIERVCAVFDDIE